jgi:hypothetical protein
MHYYKWLYELDMMGKILPMVLDSVPSCKIMFLTRYYY